MTAGELCEWLSEHTYPEQEVELQVGGDGAIHTGALRVTESDLYGGVVVLGSE